MELHGTNLCAAQQWFTTRFILLSLESAYHGVHVGRQWLMTTLVSIMMSFTVKSVMLWFHTMQSPTHIILLLWLVCLPWCLHSNQLIMSIIDSVCAGILHENGCKLNKQLLWCKGTRLVCIMSSLVPRPGNEASIMSQ